MSNIILQKPHSEHLQEWRRCGESEVPSGVTPKLGLEHSETVRGGCWARLRLQRCRPQAVDSAHHLLQHPPLLPMRICSRQFRGHSGGRDAAGSSSMLPLQRKNCNLQMPYSIQHRSILGQPHGMETRLRFLLRTHTLMAELSRTCPAAA